MKGPCTPREAVLQLAGRSENWLDEHFTLAGECVPPAILEQASCIGRQWAKEAWLFEQSAEQNLYRLGVERIRWMSPMEDRAFARPFCVAARSFGGEKVREWRGQPG